jgi:hypothetical protein
VSITPQLCFTPRERTPGTHWTGVWVGLRASLDTETRRKILCLCWGSKSSQSLYWLSYTSSILKYANNKCLLGNTGDSFGWISYHLLVCALIDDNTSDTFGRRLDWLLWSSALAAVISGLNPAWFLFMWSNERDDLQVWSTYERGTPASSNGCCCLHMRTPWNDSMGSKLLFGMSKAVHWKLWQTFWEVIRCIS